MLRCALCEYSNGAGHNTETHMFHDVVWLPCKQLHLEKSELCVDGVQLIHHGPDALVFLYLARQTLEQ